MNTKLKIYFLSVILLVALSIDSFGQILGYRQDTKFPTFNINFLVIRASDRPKKSFYFLDIEMSSFLTQFPNTDKNEDFYFEMSEEMAHLISYDECELYFLDGKLSDFRFLDPKFSIGNGEIFLKVGDHYSSVEKIFPIYNMRIEDEYQTKSPYGTIWIPLSNREIIFDEGLVIIFDAKSEKITEILF